ncbi:MAG: hypothetical protein ACYTBV_10460, partial [Planctomycetota bacterium]
LHVANHIRVGEDPTYSNVYGELKHDGGGTGFKINANAGGGWADMCLQTDGTTRLFIESGGNVGIGTTSPGFRLNVKSSGTGDEARVTSSDGDPLFRVRQASGGHGGVYVCDANGGSAVVIGGAGDTYFNGGNVGIGTTSPNDDLLHVANHIRVGEDPTYSNVYGELKHDGGGTGFKINANAGGGWADMCLQTDGTTRLFIESGGNVGIGTTNPAYDLDVNGDIRAIGSVYYGGTQGNTDANLYNKPDYVFEEGYDAMNIEQVEEFLKKENHLPWMTSVKQEKEENGDVIDMTRMAFETVETAENLQMQIIELNKRNKALEERVAALEEMVLHQQFVSAKEVYNESDY